jgi:biopolymer transport protein ExbD
MLKVLVFLVWFSLLTAACFARDVVVKVPDDLTDQQVKEWVSILIERNENQKMQNNEAIKTALETAQKSIDAYRKDNGLQAKFEASEVKES